MSGSSWQYSPRATSFQSMLPPFRGAVKALVLACTGVFILQILLQLSGFGGFDPGSPFMRLFGLVPNDVVFRGRVWQLASYLFLHGGAVHLLLNMLGLWMFGTTLEWEWGRRRFLFYYFLTGIGAGLFTVAFQYRSLIPTVGASGAIYGLLLAFGVLHPEQPIYIYGIFPVKAKWLVTGFAVMTLWSSWVASPTSGVAHLAHLGGMVVGYAYLKRVWRVGELVRDIRWRLRRRRFRVIDRRRDGGNGDPRYPFH